MSQGASKISVETYKGEVVAVWYGYDMLPFKVYDIGSNYCVGTEERRLRVLKEKEKNGEIQTDVNSALGIKQNIAPPSEIEKVYNYTPPSDELEAREA